MKGRTFEKRAMQARWSELLTAERVPRLALVCLGIWLNAADSLVTATIMPSVARDIGGYAFFAWPVAAYLTGAILGGASAGRLSERTGLRVALLLSAALYAFGCAVGALAPGMGTFLVGRLLQGAGAGLVVGLCYVSIGLLFPGGLWRLVLTVISLVWGVATILGPLLGGIFASSWRLLFWLFAAQALLFAVAAWVLVPRRSADVPGYPIPVITLLQLAVAILFLLLIRSLRYGRNARPENPLAVLEELRGTCSTKHALMKRLADEQNIPMALTVGIYEMSELNAPGVGAVLKRFGLPSLPEAHCYLRVLSKRIDLTGLPMTSEGASITDLLFEEDIDPSQIAAYKVALHKSVLESWKHRQKRCRYSLEELWSIREQCILALSTSDALGKEGEV